MKKFTRSCIKWICTAFLLGCQAFAGTMTDFVERVIPGYGDCFVFEELSVEEGGDAFSLRSEGDKIIIAGNNGVSQASGLNYYLEHYCNTQVTFHRAPVVLPKDLPRIDKEVLVESDFEYRYLFNYCTFGYTMPWWNWQRWEKMIDYMALKGVNMPLSIIGQEAVWHDVYKALGLTDAQLDEFFVGPAHLPWGWMGNIDGIGGPLPSSWYTKRTKLQQRILERQREFGMKAVLQAFTGHVPKELVAMYPEADITQIHDWAGIKGTMFLAPTDPLFKKIGTMFLKRQTELFGTDHLYDADCFIEVDPPSKDPEFLHNLSKGVYETMRSVDADAIWVAQGWFLHFREAWWKGQPTKDFFSGVPVGKVIVLDLDADNIPVWDACEAFHGHEWIWNVLCRGDQKVNMCGNLRRMQEQLSRAISAEGDKQLRGIGVMPEGIGYNDPVYDFIYGKAWNQQNVDVEEWFAKWAMRRYNTTDPRAAEAWKKIGNTLYNNNRKKWTSILATPHLLKNNRKQDIRLEELDRSIAVENDEDFASDYDVYLLAEGAEILLSMSDTLGDHPSYRFDLVNVCRELIRIFYNSNLATLTKTYEDGDLEAFDKACTAMLRMYDDLEAVTATQEDFMLGPWIEDARSWGTTEEEKDYYERNARSIISTWQPYEKATLRDYASKQWSGILSDYYRPRWTLFCQQLRDSLVNKTEFKAGAFYAATRKMDFEWTLKKDKYPTKPKADSIQVIKELWDSYYREALKK